MRERVQRRLEFVSQSPNPSVRVVDIPTGPTVHATMPQLVWSLHKDFKAQSDTSGMISMFEYEILKPILTEETRLKSA